MIHILWAIPGGGKSYIATYIGVRALLRKKNNKTVFSNYPIILHQKPTILKRIWNKIPKIIKIGKKIKFIKKEPLEDKIISSNIWDSKYIYSGLTNAVIILDEAYRDFSSKESWKFTKDIHTFFATNRHNDLEIYIIVQHPSRIEVTIREMSNIFLYVSKWINPVTGYPLWFDISGYLSEEDFKLRNMKTDMRFSHQRVFFSSEIANAYNTKFFRTMNDPIVCQKWQDVDISEYLRVKEIEKETEHEEIEQRKTIEKENLKKSHHKKK